MEPHDPLFGIGLEDARGTFAAIAVEVHRRVIFSAAGHVPDETLYQAEVQQAVEGRRGRQVFNVEVFVVWQAEKALAVKQIEVYAAPAVIKPVEDIDQRLLTPADAKVGLKDRDSFHVEIRPPSCGGYGDDQAYYQVYYSTPQGL